MDILAICILVIILYYIYTQNNQVKENVMGGKMNPVTGCVNTDDFPADNYCNDTYKVRTCQDARKTVLPCGWCDTGDGKGMSYPAGYKHDATPCYPYVCKGDWYFQDKCPMDKSQLSQLIDLEQQELALLLGKENVVHGWEGLKQDDTPDDVPFMHDTETYAKRDLKYGN
jgi:hypothetical protein